MDLPPLICHLITQTGDILTDISSFLWWSPVNTSALNTQKWQRKARGNLDNIICQWFAHGWQTPWCLGGLEFRLRYDVTQPYVRYQFVFVEFEKMKTHWVSPWHSLITSLNLQLCFRGQLLINVKRNLSMSMRPRDK